jgi:5-methylcytosine-specific restriction enzyme subunit McrC
MHLLFQAAVAGLFRRQFERVANTIITTKDTGTYLATVSGKSARRLPLRPDIVIRRGEEVIAIVDSKWKRLEVAQEREGRPSEADAYQMLAYAAGYKCPHLMLVYPWYRGLRASLLTVFELPPVAPASTRLELAFVDVLRSPLKLVTPPGVALGLPASI